MYFGISCVFKAAKSVCHLERFEIAGPLVEFSKLLFATVHYLTTIYVGNQWRRLLQDTIIEQLKRKDINIIYSILMNIVLNFHHFNAHAYCTITYTGRSSRPTDESTTKMGVAKYVFADPYIWVLASTLAPSVSEINKALSVTYKLLFILSKNIVPSRSYRYLKMDVYIRDRAFPVTRLPPPIYIKLDENNDTYI